MASASSPLSHPSSDWPEFVARSLEQAGPWKTLQLLHEARDAQPSNYILRGFIEIVRNTVVRNLINVSPARLRAVPHLSSDFLNNFDRFNLNAQEGYLISLIDGRSDLQTLLRLSPFDHFTTLFHFAKLLHERAITIRP